MSISSCSSRTGGSSARDRGPWLGARGAHGEIEGEVTKGLGVPIELKLVPRIERIGRGKHRDFVRAEDLGE